jgi:5-oxoprolinase (ATP-hydrolysing)
MTAILLANRRRTLPLGLAGGGPGQPGLNWIERNDGRHEELGATFTREVDRDEVVVIETPGGGGFGAT